MKSLAERIAGGGILVADGAMGTALMDRGLAPGGCPESFCLEREEVLAEIARAHIEAGAEVIQTNSFGASPAKLGRYGLAGRAEEINLRAARVAKRAAGGRAWVCGSCGPSGRMLRPLGDADPAELHEGFALQARALAQGGADAICVETMTDLDEAIIAVRAAKAVAPGLPVIATMTFDRTQRGFFTIMGVDIPRACARLAEAGADIVGSNCGNGMDAMIEIARQLRASTRLPLAVRPNAGAPRAHAGGVSYPETPELYTQRAPALLEAGVFLLGGCCGTSPAHIRALREAADRWVAGPPACPIRGSEEG